MGMHDINDVLPIAILDAGALLWLVSAGSEGPAGYRRSTPGVGVARRNVAGEKPRLAQPWGVQGARTSPQFHRLALSQ